MEIAGLPKIPIAMNVTLDRRKSKLVNSKGSTGLLDISSFPELTRNVSETQLLALKSAGIFSTKESTSPIINNFQNILLLQEQKL